MFGQLLQAAPVGTYLGWLHLTGRFDSPRSQYPYGLANPVEALATMTLLARLPSLLLGAGVAVLALLTAGELWGARAGRFVGAAALFLYPLGYYARTSNVDAPALFLTAAGIYVFARGLSRGIDRRRLLAFAVCAALAIATKDASFATFAACGVALAGSELWRRREERGALLSVVTLFAPASAVAALLYAVASGLVFSLDRFVAHVHWVTASTAAQVYPSTLSGTLDFLREISIHVLDSLGVPILLLSLVGLAIASRTRPRNLLLTLPMLATIVLTILPVHFVNIRYVLVPCYVLLLFSGATASALFSVKSPILRAASSCILALALAWSFLRAGDLTRQMREDTRNSLAVWMSLYARDGDLVAYWGAAQKLPRVPLDLRFVEADRECDAAFWEGAEAPAFALLIPQQHFEMRHEWSLADERFEALSDGRLGYELVYRDDGVGWFARRPIPFVNPPVRVFARRLRVNEISDRVDKQPRRVLATAEEWIGLTPGAPAGLVPNPERPVPCAS
jgi:4-amino-4-deoxy-L-arabinose transferase-like glycosyltransferase